MEAPRTEAKREKCHGYTETAISSELHHHAGEEHRSRSGRGDVAGGGPGVKGPQARKNCKTNEDQRESPHLEMERKRESGQIVERHALCPGNNIGCNESDKNHCAADEGVERKLHRTILAPCGAPDGD